MRDTSIGIGLVGCGAMGAAHAAAIAQVPAARLTAVFDPRPGPAHTVGGQYGAAVMASVTGLVMHPKVDAVVVASPTPDHHGTTLLAARHGKHVLLEKPAALTLAHLQEMQLACDGAGVILLVGQTMRFDGVVSAARDACVEGQIGKPVYINWVSNTTRRWPAGWRAWQTDRSQSGGMALHLAIHFIDLALWLLDDVPVRVYAQGNTIASSALDVHDFIQLSIRCAGGSNMLLESHSSIPGSGGPYTALRVVGTSGQLQWNSHENGTYAGAAGSSALIYGQNDRLSKEMAHFVDCCTGNTQPIVSADQAWNTLAAALAASASLEQGRAIDITQVQRGSDH